MLTSKLSSTTYNPDTCSESTRAIADEIKSKLKGMELLHTVVTSPLITACSHYVAMDYTRYKFIVNVVIGEIRGEGVK